MSIELTPETFDATVATQGIVVVDFYATWCAPCKTYYPILDKVTQELGIAKIHSENRK